MSEAPYQPQNTAPPEPPKSSRGCMMIGCIGSITLVILMVVCGGLSSYWLKGQFEKYTSETAANLPVVELGEEQLAELETEVKDFKTAIEADATPQPLVLTAEEINALIASDEDLRGRVYITIADGQISGDVSIPVGGRFFNGSATFDVKIVNDVLFVNLKDAAVKGERLPQTFIDSLANENLAKDVNNNNPEVAKLIKNLESISIEGDKIILTPKAGEDKPVDDPQQPADADTPAADADTPAADADTPAADADAPAVEADAPAVEVSTASRTGAETGLTKITMFVSRRLDC